VDDDHGFESAPKRMSSGQDSDDGIVPPAN
jgi:hypothetical protein